MKILCAILAVAVVILTCVVVCRSREDKPEVQVEKTKVIVKTTHRNPLSVETQHQIAQAEFFTSEDAQTGVAGLADASKSFDGTDGDFKDYVASKAIGADVVANHKEFIQDFTGPQSNYTGRNYTLPDSSDADMSGNWMGIRGRPQKTAVHNPDTVSDENIDSYADSMAIRY